jgi:hypothetical protein
MTALRRDIADPAVGAAAVAERQHQLSGAARAFKAHALAAAAVPAATIGATEDMYSTEPWYDALQREEHGVLAFIPRN